MSYETSLVKRAQEGDQAALAQIVEAHQDRVYKVALRMCGNVHDAEETLQETFLNVLKALPQFEGRSRLSTWLYRIASNTCLMRRRRESSEPGFVAMDESPDDQNDEFAPRYFIDWSPKPEDVLLEDEMRQVLEEAIGQLPPTLRIVFIWRELESMSTQETAEILDISEGTVKVRLHRARLKLREILSGYFSERGSDEVNDD